MKFLAITLEILASFVIVAGICLELLTGGEAGYAIISAGALGIMAGSVIYAKIFIKSHNQINFKLA